MSLKGLNNIELTLSTIIIDGIIITDCAVRRMDPSAMSSKSTLFLQHITHIFASAVARHTNPICNFDCLRRKSLSGDHQKTRITDKRETIIDFADVSGRRLTPARHQYMCIY